MLNGDGHKLAEGTRTIPPDLEEILGSRWGKDTRHASLFEHPEAFQVVQDFVERCAEVVDEGFRGTDLDLYDTGFMGAFGILLLLSPLRIGRECVVGGRNLLHAVHEQTKMDLSKPVNKDSQGDLEFFQEYMTKAERGFDLLLSSLRPA